AYQGPPPMRGGVPATVSRERCPITPSGRTAGKRNRERKRERHAEARQRRADSAVRRMQIGEEARPEAEPARLRDPLVEAEPAEPGGDHPRAPGRAAEDVGFGVVAAGDEPVGEQDAEERYEERSEQKQELLVLREVDPERDRRRRDGDEDDEQPLRHARDEVLQRHRR